MTYEFGIQRTATGQYVAGGETTRFVGACFRATDDGTYREIAQFSCPQSFLKAVGAPVETEVEVIGRQRPMIEPTGAPGVPR